MLRKILIMVAVLCSLAVGSTASAESLKIGILPVLDTLPLQAAVRDGLFEEQGLDVELVPFTSALERDTAMQTGRLDGYFGDILNTLLLIQRGVPMKVVTVSYETTSGKRMFGLVSAPGKDLAEMDGEISVGISKSTIIEYLLDQMRGLPATEGMQLGATEIKKIPIRLQMLLAGQLDAAVLPEPLLTLAESKGGTVVASDEKLSMPLTVICLHKDKLDAAKAFSKAYDAAVETINDEPEQFRTLMVETCRIPKPLAGDFPMYHYEKTELPEESEIWPVQQWMLTRGLLNGMLSYKEIVP